MRLRTILVTAIVSTSLFFGAVHGCTLYEGGSAVVDGGALPT